MTSLGARVSGARGGRAYRVAGRAGIAGTAARARLVRRFERLGGGSTRLRGVYRGEGRTGGAVRARAPNSPLPEVSFGAVAGSDGEGVWEGRRRAPMRGFGVLADPRAPHGRRGRCPGHGGASRRCRVGQLGSKSFRGHPSADSSHEESARAGRRRSLGVHHVGTAGRSHPRRRAGDVSHSRAGSRRNPPRDVHRRRGVHPVLRRTAGRGAQIHRDVHRRRRVPSPVHRERRR